MLELKDVSCRRGGRLLFSGLHLALNRGRAIWLRGRNGRGKTSLLRVAAGLAPAEVGDVTWGGVPLGRSSDYARERVYVGHAGALKDDLTLSESLSFVARLHGRAWDRVSVRRALARLGLEARCDALVRTLSQGQRRRCALARLALEAGNGPWLLDEPYDALDGDGLSCVDALLHEHLARADGSRRP
jgi:heme exporter protein A